MTSDHNALVFDLYTRRHVEACVSRLLRAVEHWLMQSSGLPYANWRPQGADVWQDPWRGTPVSEGDSLQVGSIGVNDFTIAAEDVVLRLLRVNGGGFGGFGACCGVLGGCGRAWAG